MAHQAEVEKTKYRDWVRGGLAYKYLKQGIEGFADDVVLQEHKRILQNIQHSPGQPCTKCSIGSLKPKHASACPRGQSNCSCLNRKKKYCPNQVCDEIMGDILDSHGSQPPAPYWKNADIQKWCSDPWEVAKCFINSPGYADKTSAAAIDASGLLHIFINNTKLHSHLSCAISTNGTDVFSKVRKRRNQIFHSPTMEMDQKDLKDCIADIITLLEDAKELKQRPEAKAAVEKLKQLKQNNFIITTNNEVEVCRDAMESIVKRSEELQEMIDSAKNDIHNKTKEVYEAVDDKTQKALGKALGQLEKQNDSQLKDMNERLKHVETDVGILKQQLTDIQKKLEELDTSRNKHKKQLEYVEQKQALQRSLLERYEKNGYFNTWISPLITRQNNIVVNEVYVTPNMEIEKKAAKRSSTGPFSGPETTKGWSKYHSTRGSRTPPKRVEGYRDIFQTDGTRHKKIYIIGDVGTGKSTLCKMMIFNWCRAIRDESKETETTYKKCNECHSAENKAVVLRGDDGKRNGKCQQDNPAKSNENSDTSTSWDDEYITSVNIREMSKFDFLFTIPLQEMSEFKNVIGMLKALCNPNEDVKTFALMTEIFNQESERCLIIADGLDEWTPPKYAPSPQRVSNGIPVADGVKNATLVTLSRPSARGILKMKLTEYDQKIKLLGVHKKSVNDFVSKYMDLNGKKDKKDELILMKKISQTELEHLIKTPLILQQLVWLYCTHGDIGKSVADIYSNIVNIIFGWFENKGEEDITQPALSTDGECEQIQLPELLRRFPRCEQNSRILLRLGKLAFKACDEDGISTFGRSGCGLSKDDIDILIKFGILVEHNSHDPTIQKSSLSFIHISFSEFFAAVYISGHYCERDSTPKKKSKLQNGTVLNEFFMKRNSAEDILQISNILRMICGFSPFLLEEISNLISKQMSDKRMIRYRNSLFENDEGEDIAWQIQTLINKCLLECRTDAKPAVSLCDVVIKRKPEEQILMNIVSDKIASVNLDCEMFLITEIVGIMKLFPTFHRLQFIKIGSINACRVFKHVSSFLSQAVSLKSIELTAICRDRDECEGHPIDLSNHDQLSHIYLQECSITLRSGINTKSIQKVLIFENSNRRTPHAMCEQLSSSLSQAVSIKWLWLHNIICDNCDDHSIDFSKHSQLESLVLDECSFTLGSGINTESLQEVSICENTNRRTPHAMCEQLSSSLSQAVSIKQLWLHNIICDNCDDHSIDLSKHDELSDIDLHECVFTLGSGVNTESLQEVSICENTNRRTPHAMCEQLSSSLSQAVSIKQLCLYNIICDIDNCDDHSIDFSKHSQLESLVLHKCSFTLGSGINTESLQKVSICENTNRRTPHAMCEQLSSSLSQAVSIKQLWLHNIICDNCDDHSIDLSKHSQLEILVLHKCSFTLGSGINTESLQEVSIFENSNRRTPHAMCEQLSSSLSQAVSIKQLWLHNIICDNCDDHSIDLSKHDELSDIDLHECVFTLGSGINTESLQKVSIFENSNRRTPHAMCEQLSSSLSQAVSIKQLWLHNIICDNCDDHSIDLSKHDELSDIDLKTCSFTLGSGINTESLQEVSICENTNRRTPHAMCEQLSSSLSQAVSIKQLELRNITCDRDNCEGHAIDLSKHDQLKRIHLQKCSFILGSVTNTKSLQKVDISKILNRGSEHMMFQHLTSSLSVSVYLKRHDLTIKMNRQYTPKMNDFVQTLKQLQVLELKRIDIDKDALTVTAGMHNLKDIKLDRVRMSLQTWRSFVESLRLLQHSVRVETVGLSMHKYAARQYVGRKQALFEVHATNVSRFIFSSKKTTFEN